MVGSVLPGPVGRVSVDGVSVDGVSVDGVSEDGVSVDEEGSVDGLCVDGVSVGVGVCVVEVAVHDGFVPVQR